MRLTRLQEIPKTTLVIIMLLGVALVGGIYIGADIAVADDDDPLFPATYYGNVTVAETADAPSQPVTVEAVIDGEVRGSIDVETELPFNLGGPNISDEKLEVPPPEDQEADVEFRIGDTIIGTSEWEPGTQEINFEVSEETVSSNFELDITEINSPVDAGDDVELAVAVTNTGGVEGTETVTFEFGDTDDSEEVTLAPGETDTLSFSAGTARSDRGTITAAVSSGDDTVTTSVEIQAAFFDIAIENTTTPVTAGEPLEVDVLVTNTGDTEGTSSVELQDIAGEPVDSVSTTLAPDESESLTLSWNTTITDVGSGTISVTSADEMRSTPVEIELADDIPELPGESAEPDPDGTVDPSDIADISQTATAVYAERQTIRTDAETNSSQVRFTQAAPVSAVGWNTANVSGEAGVIGFETPPETLRPLPGDVISMAQIIAPESSSDQPAVIESQIDRAQLTSLDIDDLDDIQLYRYDAAAGTWKMSDTSIAEVTETTVTVRAQTPGLSFVAMSAVAPPEAVIEPDSQLTAADESIAFSATNSTVQYGEITTYRWQMADTEMSGETVEYTFPEPGNTTVELTVETAGGLVDNASADVSVVEPFTPAVTVDAPETGTLGETTTLTARLSNTGELAGTAPFTVIANDETIINDTRTVAPNETIEEQLEIQIPSDAAQFTVEISYGSQTTAHDIEISDRQSENGENGTTDSDEGQPENGENDTTDNVEEPTDESNEGISPGTLTIIIAVLLGVAIVGALVVRRRTQ